MFEMIVEVISTLLDGAKIRQTDKCMEVLVREGYVQKGTLEYYTLLEKIK